MEEELSIRFFIDNHHLPELAIVLVRLSSLHSAGVDGESRYQTCP